MLSNLLLSLKKQDFFYFHINENNHKAKLKYCHNLPGKILWPVSFSVSFKNQKSVI